MRILMLTQFYPPVIGGEERFVRDLSAALVARGHDVAVATLQTGDLPAFEVDRGIRVYRLRGSLQRARFLFSEGGRRHAPPFPDPEVCLGLKDVITRERPTIVHAHNWLVHSFLPLKRWSGARLVVTLHDYSLACAKKKLIYKDEPCSGPGLAKCLSCASDHYGAAKGIPTAMANWSMGQLERSLVDMFLPESHAVAQGNGLPGSRARYQVLPVFVPDEIGAEQPEMAEAAAPYVAQLPREDYLLFVGAFGRYKGVDVLLNAYRGLDNAPPLAIVGYETAEYPVTVTDLPRNVVVLKDWPHFAVMEAWRRSLMGLAPSVWAEPFGLVVLEAMAMAKPVIASRTGGLVDLVDHERTGLLVRPGDEVSLRQAMQRLVGDAALRERMGLAGQQKLREFQASSVLPRLEQVYRDLAGAASVPVRPNAAVEAPVEGAAA
jgi:glycosyltransferase involved in cell wall biosynthesis